jgi:hypothetical protein
MVIGLRAAWPTLPAVQRLPPGVRRKRLLDRVATLASAEFYQPADGGETAQRATGVHDSVA